MTRPKATVKPTCEDCGGCHGIVQRFTNHAMRFGRIPGFYHRECLPIFEPADDWQDEPFRHVRRDEIDFIGRGIRVA